MGYLFGQKRRKVSRLQRQAARCFLVTQEASSVELGTWCWPRVVLIEKRPLTECERSSMKRAARSVGACQSRQRPSAAFCRASSLGHRISGESQGQSDFARVYTTKPLVRAPSGYATATRAPSKAGIGRQRSVRRIRSNVAPRVIAAPEPLQRQLWYRSEANRTSPWTRRR